MTDPTTARHRVAIAGHALDARTGKAIAGAVLVIADMPEGFRKRLQRAALQWGPQWQTMRVRPDKTISREDGLFYFLDLPQGEYQLHASAESRTQHYGEAQAQVNVVYDKTGNFTPSWTSVSLPPTGIQGIITSRKSPVVHSSVSLRGSGEAATTDTQGHYVLTGIEPGRRTLSITAQGFRPLLQPVLIAGPGQIVTTDCSLQRAGA